MFIELNTPSKWLTMPRYEGVKILDPDGWRGAGAPSWDKPISESEFDQRLAQCTCQFKRNTEFLKG